MDRRALVFAAALPLGLAVGSTAWLLAAHPAGALAMPLLADRLRAISSRSPVQARQPDGLAAAAATTPLFALATGPGATADIQLKLDGLVRSPGRVAALLSIGGAPSDWLELGQSRQGVTLQDVSSSKVVVDTALGLREVALGETTGPTDPQPQPQSPPQPQPQPQLSFRHPLPPASAPGKRR